MTELTQFPLDGGGTIVVAGASQQIPRDSTVFRGVSAGEVLARSGETIQSAVDRVKPAAAALVETFSELPRRPDTVSVTFGIALNAEFGAIIATTSAQAHFSVTLTWGSGSGDDPAAEEA